MRRRQLKWLWGRLAQIAAMKLTRKELLMKLGAARSQARTAWRLIVVTVPKTGSTFSYRLDPNKFQKTRRRQGPFLFRPNLTQNQPAAFWNYLSQLIPLIKEFQ